MINDIANYVHIYFDYQRVRIYYHKFYNELILILSNNVNSFYIIILNFIINLLFVRNSYINKTCDFILILINKLIKHATYIIIIKDLKVNEFIDII